MISGNMVGSYSQIGKTFILEDESGTEITGVIVGQEVMFDATDNDVREGKKYASDCGVSIGTKMIPSYVTSHGTKKIAVGGKLSLRLTVFDAYDYTVFHGIICTWNTSLSNSVAAEKISVLDKVYPVNSTEAIANIERDYDSKSIILGITNNSDSPLVIRYITYKEID